MSKRTTELAWRIWEKWCLKVEQRDIKRKRGRSPKEEIRFQRHEENRLLTALQIMMRNKVNTLPVTIQGVLNNLSISDRQLRNI